MKANVQYNDFKGTAAADISDGLGGAGDMKGLAKFFDLDEDRFTPIGISLYGTNGFSVSILCVDKEQSTEEKEHIVSMSYDVENKGEIIDFLFKRLHIVLHDKFDNKYPNLDYDEEISYSDFHETDDEE